MLIAPSCPALSAGSALPAERLPRLDRAFKTHRDAGETLEPNVGRTRTWGDLHEDEMGSADKGLKTSGGD